jgi:hypothetical protein
MAAKIDIVNTTVYTGPIGGTVEVGVELLASEVTSGREEIGGSLAASNPS